MVGRIEQNNYIYITKKGCISAPYFLIFKTVLFMSTTKVFIPAYFPKSEIKGAAPFIATMSITPDIAAHWLSTYNASNRPLNKRHMWNLSNQIESGQWIELNGDTISFNNDGQLNDGQHRLAAIVKSKTPLKYMVVLGVPKQSFQVMDTGRKRTAADVLAIDGRKEYSLVASVAKFLIKWDKGAYSDAATGSYSPTNTEIKNFVDMTFDKLSVYCRLALKYYGSGDKLLTATILTSFLYLFSQKDSKMAEKFIFKLATGADISYGTGLYFLRNKLHNAKVSDSKKIPARTKLAFVVKVWNGMRKGKDVQKLSFNPSKGEKFPKII